MANIGKDGNQHDNISDDDAIAAYCLTLPGETLYLTPCLLQKKFRNRGNKDGAVRAFLQLEEEGMGKTLVVGGDQLKVKFCVQFSCVNPGKYDMHFVCMCACNFHA